MGCAKIVCVGRFNLATGKGKALFNIYFYTAG